MNKKILAVMLMVAMMVTAMSTVTMAEDYVDDGNYPTLTDPATQDHPDQGEFSFPVKVKLAGVQIKYSVVITCGAMKFDYSYGGTWDPATHSYTGSSAGWDSAGSNGTNDKIEVANNSNFPVKIEYSYDALSAADPLKQEVDLGSNVKGHFSDNTVARDAMLAMVPSTALTQAIENKTVVLPMVDTGSGRYYKTNSPNAASANNNTVYFSLVGTPSNGLTTPDHYTAGNITITITPDDKATMTRS